MNALRKSGQDLTVRCWSEQTINSFGCRELSQALKVGAGVILGIWPCAVRSDVHVEVFFIFPFKKTFIFKITVDIQ